MNNNTIISVNQPLIFGNRCNHLPKVPRIYEYQSKNKKRRPPVIEKCRRGLIESYKNPFMNDFVKTSFHTKKSLKTGHFRKVRSELRESTLLRVGQWIISHVNLITKKVGFFAEKDNFFHYNLSKMRKDTGISLSQSNRAVKRLKDLGYINITTIKEQNKEGKFVTRETIIEVNDNFFYDLGIEYKELYRDKINLIRRNNYVYKTPKKKLKLSPMDKDKELPGHDRRRSENNLYPDYTGLANDKSRFNRTTTNNSSPFKHILDYLKKGPPE